MADLDLDFEDAPACRTPKDGLRLRLPGALWTA